ncbi:MAG: alpha/beta hydrolase [Candidatus Kariarchaeaceae archaeon]|jgi:alpha-beta hydrolase superfamily lysophospholipase
MNHDEGFFNGINDTQLYYQVWKPSGEFKGVLLIIHGYGEHSGRYMNVVNTVIPEGYAVFAMDHRGHGKSEGRRVYVDRFTDYLEDIEIFEKLVRSKAKEVPFHMLGHSMGSLIANHYIATIADQQSFQSLILSGSGASPGPGINTIKRYLGKIFSSILPKLSLSAGLDPNGLCNDKKVVEDYINDPLVQTNITTRLANEMMNCLFAMGAKASKLSVPTLVVVGSEDETFRGWQPLFDAIASDDKDFKIYEGLKHEIFNEIEKEIPLNDLLAWINSHN